MEIKPIGSKILVLPDGADSTTDSGILLRAEDRDAEQWGTVQAVGPDTEQVKNGDRILYEKFAGSPVAVQNTEYLIMDEADVIAIQTAL